MDDLLEGGHVAAIVHGLVGPEVGGGAGTADLILRHGQCHVRVAVVGRLGQEAVLVHGPILARDVDFEVTGDFRGEGVHDVDGAFAGFRGGKSAPIGGRDRPGLHGGVAPLMVVVVRIGEVGGGDRHGITDVDGHRRIAVRDRVGGGIHGNVHVALRIGVQGHVFGAGDFQHRGILVRDVDVLDMGGGVAALVHGGPGQHVGVGTGVHRHLHGRQFRHDAVVTIVRGG